MNSILPNKFCYFCIFAFWIIIALLSSFTAFAQTTISGKIIDSLTNEPLTSASIFLENESKSTSSLSDGTFVINGVAPGKHVVIVSYVGYQKYIKATFIQGATPTIITAYLLPVVQSLKDVDIGAPISPKNRAVLVEKFEQALFGNSENALRCKILNPDVLNIRFDKKNNALSASSDSFLMIRNRALGYNINILLDEFLYDYKIRARNYRGKIYFSEISGSSSEQKKWNRNRAETYMGSLRHFLKSAVNNTFTKEGFVVHPIISDGDTGELSDPLIANKIKKYENGNADSLRYWKDAQASAIKHYIVTDKFLTEKNLVKELDKPGLYELKFDKHIYFSATRKQVLVANGTYNQANTVLTLIAPTTLFDLNGILMRPSDLISQSENPETIADLLPNDYTLSKSDEALFTPAYKSEMIVKSKASNDYIERLYLRTSRDLYESGDTVWLSGYLVNARNNRLSGHSSKLYTELIGSNNNILSRKILKLEDGIIIGDILLDDTLATGNYRIRAYTNWIKNFGNDFVFEKEIEVKGKTALTLSTANKTDPLKASPVDTRIIAKFSAPSIHFYPESGSLITDVYSRVAFTVADSSGYPLQIKCKIVTAAGDSICGAASNTNGVGDFFIKPRPDVSYYFVGQEIRKALAPVLSEGYSLFVQEKDTLFNILISTNPATLKKDAGKKIKLFIKHAGINIAALTLTVKLLQQSIKVPKRILFQGINVISIEDADNRPLAERLIFSDVKQKLNFSLQRSNTVENSKDKLDVCITLTDSLGLPVKGHMSISVISHEQYNTETGNVMSYMMLSSEIKGAIYKPSQYFDESNPDRKEQLDLLLRTQGWRDYLWKYHSLPIAVPAKYKAEAGFELQGSIIKSNGTAAVNIPVSLYIPGAKQQKLFTTQTDTAGNYNFLLDEVYGNQTYTISAVDSKGRAFGKVESKLVNTDTLTLVTDRTSNALNHSQISKGTVPTNEAAVSSLNTINAIHKLKEINIKSRVNTQLLEGSYTTFGYKEENFEVMPADYDFKDLKHYLLTRSSYAMQDRASNIYVCSGDHAPGSSCKHEPIISKRPGQCPCGAELTLNITQASDRIMFAGQDSLIAPQLFVNGRQVLIPGPNNGVESNAVYQQYFNLSMKDVRSVKIRKGLINNDTGSKIGYLLYIDLKHDLQSEDGKFRGNFEGYYQAKIFYSPAQKIPPSTLLKKTGELYWTPNIVIGSKEPHKFTLFPNSIKDTYLIITEGLTDDGVPFYNVFDMPLYK